ncbi:uncharacterized protein B0H64DRAFT_370899 [Chaetomium fimeti]|uniref:Uncharacterized protein n=1 Tax=Chaetomium fimeti TaxID=1854472 RepID=A0AAE0HL17_9PEZI|nr:hypothetical protein B0H64DRAFT_370899 [Chaetomium fimeti]
MPAEKPSGFSVLLTSRLLFPGSRLWPSAAHSIECRVSKTNLDANEQASPIPGSILLAGEFGRDESAAHEAGESLPIRSETRIDQRSIFSAFFDDNRRLWRLVSTFSTSAAIVNKRTW